jgi:glycosyltransferase involved in cell wall biosynthesis
MDSAARVSIIIPVYNGSNYLAEAIESALAQTYPNTEVIVVNDGSDDEGRTGAVAQSFGGRIRYFSKENGGVSSALNFGIRHMTGEWFAWLSHDDLYSPDRIENDMEVIRSHPDAKVTFCNTYYINENRETIRRSHYSLKEISDSRQIFDQGVNMCSMTIHKTCFDNAGLFDESNRTTQDVIMMLRLSMSYNFFLNEKSVFYSREHPTRDTHLLSGQHRLDLLKVGEFMLDVMDMENFFPRQIKNGVFDPEEYFWMGSAYEYFGATGYADEYYTKSLKCRNHFFARLRMRMKIVKRKVNRLLVSLHRG